MKNIEEKKVLNALINLATNSCPEDNKCGSCPIRKYCREEIDTTNFKLWLNQEYVPLHSWKAWEVNILLHIPKQYVRIKTDSKNRLWLVKEDNFSVDKLNIKLESMSPREDLDIDSELARYFMIRK